LIPALGLNGYLAAGRHPASLPEVEADFVNGARFANSVTRRELWEKFLSYLQAWQLAEEDLGAEVLLGVWLAGSFVSDTLDPSDIDVSPIYDDLVLTGAAGQTGVGAVKRLFKHRSAVVRDFSVEPFAVPWRPIPSTLFPETLGSAEQSVLSVRGGVDSWWGRVRPVGARVAPLAPTTLADRGYLEVML
jgi:hypothetical protein